MQSDSFVTPDGETIHTIYYAPLEDHNRVIILVHGLSEHSGRYEHVAERLAQAGYHVYSQDNRGHGRSSGERQYVDSHTRFVTDLKQHYDRIRRKHRTASIYMLGHSLGSIISLQFILTYPDAIEAIIVTGTATDVGPTVSRPMRFMGNLVERLGKGLPISSPGGSELLTRDPEMQQWTDDDELMYRGWTKTGIARFALDTGEKIQDLAHEITLPILIMHGTDDDITPISGSHIMFERVRSEDKTLKLWDDMRHEVLNEIEREAVLKFVVDWLDRH
ncbi:MAG: lysophospholipase [Chloroflexota bacterium]